MNLLLTLLIGAPLWMLILKLLSWIGGFPLEWGMAYVFGFVVAYFFFIMNRFLKRGLCGR